MTVTAEFCLLR